MTDLLHTPQVRAALDFTLSKSHRNHIGMVVDHGGDSECSLCRDILHLVSAIRAAAREERAAEGTRRFILANRFNEETLLDESLSREGAEEVRAHHDAHNAFDGPHRVREVFFCEKSPLPPASLPDVEAGLEAAVDACMKRWDYVPPTTFHDMVDLIRPFLVAPLEAKVADLSARLAAAEAQLAPSLPLRQRLAALEAERESDLVVYTQRTRERDALAASHARLQHENEVLVGDYELVGAVVAQMIRRTGLAVGPGTTDRAPGIGGMVLVLAENYLRLQEALEKYGEHLDHCESDFERPCTCGLDAALKGDRLA